MTRRTRRVMLVVPNGIVARDVFQGGLTSALSAAGVTVQVATQAPSVVRTMAEATSVDEWFTLGGSNGTSQHAAGELLELARPDLVVAPTPRYPDADIALNDAARRAAIPIVYALSSWDNLHKGRLPLRGATTCVWSPAMRDRAISHHGARPGDVHVVGPLQFVPYSRTNRAALSRDDMARRYRLDARQPIIVVATTGLLRAGFDEATLVDFVHSVRADAQVIFRIHPDEWERYAKRFDGSDLVRLDYQARLLDAPFPHRWYMDPEHMAATATLLEHMDLMISIGTTMHLEATLMDSASVVSGFVPGATHAQVKLLEWVREDSHLAELINGGVLPYAPDEAALADVIRSVQAGRSAAANRAAMLRRFVGPADDRVAARISAISCEVLRA